MKNYIKITTLSLTALAILSLTGCGNNTNKQSSASTDQTEQAPKKKVIKKAKTNKKATNNQTETQTGQNQASTNQASTKPTTSTSTPAPTQTQHATTNTTPKTSAPVIKNADMAADLIIHAMGYSYNRGQFVGTPVANGFYVKSTEDPNYVQEYIVHPNGDQYDLNGNLIGTFAQLSGPTQNQPEGWGPTRK